MRLTRSIYIILFLTLFIYGKAHAVYNFKGKVVLNKKNIELKLLKISCDYKKEGLYSKKKNKTKGIGTGLPQLPIIRFEYHAFYNRIILLTFEQNHSSFLDCLDPQRGPPLM